MKLNIYKEIFLPNFYEHLEDWSTRIILFYGGGASGKSYFAFQKIVLKCLIDKRKVVVLRNTAVNCRRSCYEDTKFTLEYYRIARRCEINKTNMDIDFPNGSKIMFLGLDDYTKLKSIPGITDIVIEECSEVKKDDFSECKIRTRGKGRLPNQIYLMMNPVSKVNWTYKHFFENGCLEDNCLIMHSTYKDNPFVGEDVVKSLESFKITNPYFYKVYCLGEFGSLSKLVFNDYNVYEEMDFPQDVKWIVGNDYGYTNDVSAVVLVGYSKAENKLFIDKEITGTGMLTSDLFDANTRIKSELNRPKRVKTYGDSAEPRLIEELKGLGLNIEATAKGAGSIMQGINWILSRDIYINKSCVETLKEFENYSYKKDKTTGEYLSEPEDQWNHCIDSIRYACHKWSLGKQNKVYHRVI